MYPLTETCDRSHVSTTVFAQCVYVKFPFTDSWNVVLWYKKAESEFVSVFGGGGGVGGGFLCLCVCKAKRKSLLTGLTSTVELTVIGYTRRWYTGMRYWKQCFVSPAPPRFSRNFYRCAFPTILEQSTSKEKKCAFHPTSATHPH